MPKAKYRDFSEMPPEALMALSRDLSNPKAAIKRIMLERAAHKSK